MTWANWQWLPRERQSLGSVPPPKRRRGGRLPRGVRRDAGPPPRQRRRGGGAGRPLRQRRRGGAEPPPRQRRRGGVGPPQRRQRGGVERPPRRPRPKRRRDAGASLRPPPSPQRAGAAVRQRLPQPQRDAGEGAHSRLAETGVAHGDFFPNYFDYPMAWRPRPGGEARPGHDRKPVAAESAPSWRGSPRDRAAHLNICLGGGGASALPLTWPRGTVNVRSAGRTDIFTDVLIA